MKRSTKELFIACLQQDTSENEARKIARLCKETIDWGDFIYMCVHHRVTPLIVKKLSSLEAWMYVENHVRRALEHICTCIRYQNEQTFQEVKKISEIFECNNIDYAVLKGVYLAADIYDDKSLRQFGDIDFLVREEHLGTVTKILLEEGYEQGKLDVKRTAVIPASQYEKIKKRVTSHELVEFLKINKDYLNSYFMIDVNFSISWKSNSTENDKYMLLTKYFLENAVEFQNEFIRFRSLNTECNLIHLCVHLYNEAIYFNQHTNWYRDKSDLNLIKFCDIQQLLWKKNVDWALVRTLSHEYQLDVPLFYALKLTEKVFPQLTPKDFLDELNCNSEVVDVYIDEQENVQKWNVTFSERLFEQERKVHEIIDKRPK